MRMRSLKSGLLRSLVLALPVLALAAPAEAGGLYRWVTEDGVVAFTDDPDRIPPRYQPLARQVARKRLVDHSRFTPTDPAATTAYTARLSERVERLRELNAAIEDSRVATRATAPAPRSAVTLRAGPNTQFEFEVNDSSGPVIVEEKRVLDRDSRSTRRVTIVRQGDETLSIVKGWNRWSRADWGTLQELEAGR
jgi:hypothetical protein